MTRTPFCFGIATVSLAATWLSIHNECAREAHTMVCFRFHFRRLVFDINMFYINIPAMQCYCLVNASVPARAQQKKLSQGYVMNIICLNYWPVLYPVYMQMSFSLKLFSYRIFAVCISVMVQGWTSTQIQALERYLRINVTIRAIYMCCLHFLFIFS